MNMVKEPQSSVQPVELEFTLLTMACQPFNLEERFGLFGGGLLPPCGGKSSMLDYGKDQHQGQAKLLWETH